MFEFFALDMWEQPNYFWLGFVGIPLIFIGFVLSGSHIQRFLFNQQRDNLRETMKVMGEGLREGLRDPNKICGKCSRGNDTSANFCSHCGSAF